MKKKISDYLVFVLGGSNMDIIGTPKRELVLHDSNISNITMSFGGVGRNIAENLARMGFSVQLMTVLGNDEYANLHKTYLNKLNVDLKYTMSCLDDVSCVYICINDEKGDMYVGLNDMNICDIMKPEIIPINAINECDACVFDTNLPDKTIEYICTNVRIPIFVDTVSTKKAKKLENVLQYIHTLKPNRMEAESLTGLSDPMEAAQELINRGIKNVFVSIGDDGMICANRDGVKLVKQEQFKGKLTNTTGAGDSSTAALCASYLLDFDVDETMKLNSKVTALTLESPFAVSEHLSSDVIKSIKGRD